jgi:hypothetical protein
MTFPTFSSGEVLRAADMNAVGLWRVTNCTVSSVGGTAATASNGVITIGTGNTSVTVNNAFSSDYQNYRIVIENTTTNGTASHQMQLNGQTTLYYNAGEYFLWGTGGATFFNPVAASVWTLSANVANGFYTHAIIELMNPQKPTVTSGSCVSQSGNGGYNAQLLNSNTAASTAFTISKVGDTMTGGTIRVYGYRD